MQNLPENIEVIVKEFINEVNKVLGNRLKKIILYGSYARGDYNEGSDVDIMVLTDLTDDEISDYRDELAGIAFDIEYENDFNVTLSPIIRNINKFNNRVEVIPFYTNVQKEGVQLYG